MSLTGAMLSGVVGRFPPALIRSMARQYAAGATREDALREAIALQGRGVASTIAVLGEAASTADYAAAQVAELTGFLDAVRVREGAKLDVHVGVKPTALGIDTSQQLLADNLGSLARAAAAVDGVVEVDMEQLRYVDRTLDSVREARREHGNFYAVVQAYLHRTADDVARLIAEGTPARIVKGTYKEDAGHAYRLRESVRANFLALVRSYLEAGVKVCIATHDEYLVVEALRLIRDLGAPREGYEFQMIMGVQETLRQSLADAGHPVRATVHFGTDLHLWSVRRLKENPEIARYAARGIHDALVHRRERVR
jgi:proline dehydrogenase